MIVFTEMRRNVANTEGTLWLFVSLNDQVVLDCASWQLTCDSIAQVSRGEAVGYIIGNHIPVVYISVLFLDGSSWQLLHNLTGKWVGEFLDEMSTAHSNASSRVSYCFVDQNMGRQEGFPGPWNIQSFLMPLLPVFCYDVTTTEANYPWGASSLCCFSVLLSLFSHYRQMP